jgi:SAM-dependent methyltransferase
MRADIYQSMAKVEDAHWWFRGRRKIAEYILGTITLPKSATILDAGCGTGGNLSMLSKFGKVYAMEMDESARVLADKRNIVKTEYGRLPDAIAFGDQFFDLIALFDVLEHVEQDLESLIALKKRLAAGGKILLTVPAFPFLWSGHDISHHHKRRYRLTPLIQLFKQAGYKVTFANYINFWLFPLIALTRVFYRLKPNKESKEMAELFLPAPQVNRLLEMIFAGERYLLPIMRLPFGVSIVLLAQKDSL